MLALFQEKKIILYSKAFFPPMTYMYVKTLELTKAEEPFQKPMFTKCHPS